ncbi:uncharacterized protein LOC105689903 isoform X1 [Athalia rosae]|uniref:uncharacterized protein LOC105689903 isoform X1 n=1 Tax=Athalia rosae TaxID=37344 RepID=UPI0020337E34|nr:uncharacterized protein LOC105689903 isoform X1 [Athalia rosae]
MATPEFDVELFEKRLQSLKDSQESIQALSSWCLERRPHHKKIVATWLQVLKKVKVEHRLTLFYLANDVIQYSKRKNYEFVESWGTTLQRATTMVRDEKVKHRILRIFKIWDQRQVYDEEFLADLSGLLSAAPKKKPDPQPTIASDEFQASLLISTMRSCATLEQATDARLQDLRDSNTDIDNAEELCASLKDRRHVEDAEKDVDIAVRNIENYVSALEAEIRERTQVLDLLEQADQFYETQRGEVKIVTNAYRNFGSRVKNLKKKLDELLPTLVSPIPSPDINAPSPSPDSDIELPGDDHLGMNQSSIIDIPPPSMYGSYRQDYEPMPVPAPDQSHGNMPGDFTGNFSSFMGGNVEFDMRNIFNDRSATPTGMSQYNDSLEAKPIEVINMRPSKTEGKADGFNISSFLKSVLPSSEIATNNSNIPGLGLDGSGPPMKSPPPGDYRHSSPLRQHLGTPVNSRQINVQNTPLGNLSNCQLPHSTPLSGVRSLTIDSHTPSPYSSQNSQGNNTSMNLAFDSTGNSVNPLPPPPMPPPIFLDDENCYNKLPPKFPTWSSGNELNKEPLGWDDKGFYEDATALNASDNNSMNPIWPADNGDNRSKSKAGWLEDLGNDHWDSGNDVWPNARSKNIMLETPESPPLFEKAGFIDPIEYDDSQPQEPLLSSSGDVDHRVIPMPMVVENQLPHRLMKTADVDHRNLISLTGSPANHNNPTDQALSVTGNPNWPQTDQDYRQQMQPGDIVESVDMEMSDDEVDGKPKGGRVLVDLRQQDRDSRALLPPPSHHLDMDMRRIPLPGGQLPPQSPLLQTPNSHGIHQNQSQFHHNQPDFRGNHQMNFRQNHPDFHPNQPNFHQNPPVEFRHNEPNVRPNQPNFHQNQQEFYQNQQQEFRQNQQQQEFRQNQQQQPEFEFQENQNARRRISQEFQGEPPQCPRFPIPVDHHQRESPNFLRNERGRGRGFPRNRRDRFSEDHNQQRNLNQINNRRPRHLENQKSPTELLPNNRPLLLRPPDTVVVLDDDGTPISIPTDNESDQVQSNSQERPHEDLNQNQEIQSNQDSETSAPIPDEEESPEKTSDRVIEQELIPERETSIPPNTEEKEEDTAQETLSSEIATEVLQPPQQETEKSDQDEPLKEPPTQNVEQPRQLSEQLEALMNSNSKQTNNNLKRQSENGNYLDQQEEGTPVKKRTLLPNGPPISHLTGGPLIPNAPLLGPNGTLMTSSTPIELHPVVVYEYDNANSGFRPRGGGNVGPQASSFSPWRGSGPPRGRGGFRGGPRPAWTDRGARGGGPRGTKRGGGQFRGGFRGRGRGNNW